mmetsp:Transcript_40759/g.128517  ORF Transcript_40759/g.128517 Transcript_40759/m.128517 type:complete len:222 (-) Transcript_40759:236-901(-)
MVRVIGEEGICLPDDVSAIVDESAPESAGLVPARVAGVGPKDEQQRERRARDREGQRRQRDGLDVAVCQCADVRDAVKVLVGDEEHVDGDDEDGGHRDEGHLVPERLDDPAAPDRLHVPKEPLARAVPHPVVVHEDRAAVLALLLGVGGALPPPGHALIAVKVRVRRRSLEPLLVQLLDQVARERKRVSLQLRGLGHDRRRRGVGRRRHRRRVRRHGRWRD